MQDKPRTQRGVGALAGCQHGVVTTAQLADLGWSRQKVSRAKTNGWLYQAHQGVYGVGHPVLSPEARCMAAVLSCGEGALLSHLSGAWLWGIAGGCGAVIDVTAAAPRHQQASIRVHSAITITDEDRAEREGIPVTSVPRIALDVAATSPHLLAWVLDRALRRGLLDLISCDSLLARSRGQRGVARMRLALEEHRESGETKSRVERRFLRLIREAELPKPRTNLFIEGYELDAYWPDQRFAVELDTYDYHGDVKSFEEDRYRQEDLKLKGIEMIRITGARIRQDPRGVATRLRRHLRQRHIELRANRR